MSSLSPDDNGVSAISAYGTGGNVGTRITVDELCRRIGLDCERRGYLPTTIKKRLMCLRAFAAWMAPESALSANRDQVQDFLDSRHVTPRTVNMWISHLNRFYEWAIDNDLLTVNPCTRVIRPKTRRYLPRPIGDADLRLAIDAAPTTMRAMLTLAAFAGLRCQEIAGVAREDLLLDRPDPILVVSHGKGGRERIVPIHADVLAALHAVGLPRTGFVLRRPRGGAYTPRAVSGEINQHLDDLGIDATAHMLRHWFGTHLYANCKDIRVVQELLGHRSAATTGVYVAWSPDEGAAAVHQLIISNTKQKESTMVPPSPRQSVA